MKWPFKPGSKLQNLEVIDCGASSSLSNMSSGYKDAQVSMFAADNGIMLEMWHNYDEFSSGPRHRENEYVRRFIPNDQMDKLGENITAMYVAGCIKRRAR